MSTQRQLRKGSAADTAEFTGALGELTYNTDDNSLHVHDAVTTGGHKIVSGHLYAAVFKNDGFGSAVDNMINGRIDGVVSVTHVAGNIYTAEGSNFRCDVNNASSINDFTSLDGINLYCYGAKGDGSQQHIPMQNAFSSDFDVNQLGGDFDLATQVVITKAKNHIFSPTAKITSTASGSAFSITPTLGVDPKGMEINGINFTNTGAVTNVFAVNLATAGRYSSKLMLSNCISHAPVSQYFLQLINTIPNQDGFFTSVVKDNWSFNGYYLENVGDSLQFLRNTVTGSGYAYYLNQLGTAANIYIAHGNCTTDGNALLCVKGSNITFHDMQCELNSTFTGQGNSMIYIDRTGTEEGLVFNTKITSNNINTKGNVKSCIRLQETDLTEINGNQLYCHPDTGAHIVIESLARNTIIGRNKYFNTVNGGEITPIIEDNGVGTAGVWKDAVIQLAGWESQSTSNEHALGFYKHPDGTVKLRGRVAGVAASVNDLLFTLPTGFRPRGKAYDISAGGVNIAVTVAGSVRILTAGTTLVNFNSVSFSTL